MGRLHGRRIGRHRIHGYRVRRHDFYGADRHGANLYANCVLALDARTGQRLWHFQTTHHDLWDHDNPCPPVLCQVTRDGQKLDAVAQVTKTGFCYVLDRKTGKPLFDVNEVPVAASTVPGEQANPTQPMPVAPPPLAKLRFTEDDVTDRTPEARQAVLERLKTINYGGFADPPSERGTVNIPGFHGGATWSGASFDPSTGLLYVNTNNALHPGCEETRRRQLCPDGLQLLSRSRRLPRDQATMGTRDRG